MRNQHKHRGADSIQVYISFAPLVAIISECEDCDTCIGVHHMLYGLSFFYYAFQHS